MNLFAFEVILLRYLHIYTCTCKCSLTKKEEIKAPFI